MWRAARKGYIIAADSWAEVQTLADLARFLEARARATRDRAAKMAARLREQEAQPETVETEGGE